jgi:addiction module HigA family antidote
MRGISSFRRANKRLSAASGLDPVGRYERLTLITDCVIEKSFMKSTLLANITPGEILEEDFLKPLGLSQYRLAKDIGVPARRINEIVKGERAITADTALRLGRYFKMSAQFWLNLQSHYDLEVVGDRLGRRLEREVKELATA